MTDQADISSQPTDAGAGAAAPEATPSPAETPMDASPETAPVAADPQSADTPVVEAPEGEVVPEADPSAPPEAQPEPAPDPMAELTKMVQDQNKAMEGVQSLLGRVSNEVGDYRKADRDRKAAEEFQKQNEELSGAVNNFVADMARSEGALGELAQNDPAAMESFVRKTMDFNKANIFSQPEVQQMQQAIQGIQQHQQDMQTRNNVMTMAMKLAPQGRQTQQFASEVFEVVEAVKSHPQANDIIARFKRADGSYDDEGFVQEIIQSLSDNASEAAPGAPTPTPMANAATPTPLPGKPLTPQEQEDKDYEDHLRAEFKRTGAIG